MTPATLDRAREAKAKLSAMLEDVEELCGIGIAVVDGGYGVRVNLSGEPPLPIPDDVDGVPVIVVMIDEIRPL